MSPPASARLPNVPISVPSSSVKSTASSDDRQLERRVLDSTEHLERTDDAEGAVEAAAAPNGIEVRAEQERARRRVARTGGRRSGWRRCRSSSRARRFGALVKPGACGKVRVREGRRDRVRRRPSRRSPRARRSRRAGDRRRREAACSAMLQRLAAGGAPARARGAALVLVTQLTQSCDGPVAVAAVITVVMRDNEPRAARRTPRTRASS